MQSRNDVRITLYNTKKGEVCAIKFSTDIKESRFKYCSYIKLDFKEDRLYFIPCSNESGVKLNSNGLAQVAKKCVVDILKCFEGSYDLEIDSSVGGSGVCYIDYNCRYDVIYNKNYDSGTSGNRTNHGSTKNISTGSKDYDYNASLTNVADSVKECTYYKKNSEMIKEPEDKPYAIVKKKSQNDTPLVLVGLAIKPLDEGDEYLAKSTLLTLRELLMRR